VTKVKRTYYCKDIPNSMGADSMGPIPPWPKTCGENPAAFDPDDFFATVQ